ncbi:ABC transporter permease [bacterium]|nr:MAG: ABC transporter permease [bacterium]
MSLRRLIAVAKKEFLHILRDPRSLILALALPMFLLFLFGYALTLDVDRVHISVWDQSSSPQSRELAARFEGSRYFEIQSYGRNYDELVAGLDKGDTLAALVIPPDFPEKLKTGQTAKVQLIIDGSNSNTASIALGYAEAVVEGYSREVAVESVERALGAGAGDLLTPPLELRPRVWFNSELESKNYIVPGLIALIIMVIAGLLTSLTVAREWERGTMEQLISTPVKGVEIIAGKLLPYFLIGMLDVTMAVFLGKYLFGVPLRGSLPFLFGVSAIFVAGALSMGLLISTVTKNQFLANQLAFVTTFLPAFLLSGFVYSLRNAPVVVETISRIVPARYYITMIRGIYLKGIGFPVIAEEALYLTLFGVLMAGLSILKFKKKLE